MKILSPKTVTILTIIFEIIGFISGCFSLISFIVMDAGIGFIMMFLCVACVGLLLLINYKWVFLATLIFIVILPFATRYLIRKEIVVMRPFNMDLNTIGYFIILYIVLFFFLLLLRRIIKLKISGKVFYVSTLIFYIGLTLVISLNWNYIKIKYLCFWIKA